MSPRVRRLLTSLLAVSLALAVAACARRPADLGHPVGPRLGAPLPSVPATETTATSEPTSSVTPTASIVPSGPPLPAIDATKWMGRPLKRAPWPTKKVAITLDDGPSDETSAVLAAFERADARATFFWVGDRSSRYGDLVRRAADEGFQIGNHTWDHQEIDHVSRTRVLSEVDRAEAELERLSGVAPVFARPPVGHYDQTTLRSLNERGLVLALWSVHGQDTGERGRADRPDVIARRVVGEAKGGDIILLHERNAHTVQALPAIIDGLERKGLEPVTLSELLVR